MMGHGADIAHSVVWSKEPEMSRNHPKSDVLSTILALNSLRLNECRDMNVMTSSGEAPQGRNAVLEWPLKKGNDCTLRRHEKGAKNAL